MTLYILQSKCVIYHVCPGLLLTFGKAESGPKYEAIADKRHILVNNIFRRPKWQNKSKF